MIQTWGVGGFLVSSQGSRAGKGIISKKTKKLDKFKTMDFQIHEILGYQQLTGPKSKEKQAHKFRYMMCTLTYQGQTKQDTYNKSLSREVGEFGRLVESHCVLTPDYGPLGFTELGKSEPFTGFFSTNSTEHSHKRLKKVATKCPLLCSPEKRTGSVMTSGTQTVPRPFDSTFLWSQSFHLCGDSQPKDTCENPLQVEKRKRGEGMDPL